MILEKEVVTKWANSTKVYYESLGYIYAGKGKEFLVNVEYLTKSSGVMITSVWGS